jgi:hypothetical protein
MIQTKTKNNDALDHSVIGSRIVFLRSDSTTELKFGDLGTITDLTPLPRGSKYMLSVDWDNNSSLPLIDGEDGFEILPDE